MCVHACTFVTLNYPFSFIHFCVFYYYFILPSLNPYRKTTDAAANAERLALDYMCTALDDLQQQQGGQLRQYLEDVCIFFYTYIFFFLLFLFLFFIFLVIAIIFFI